MDRWHLKINNIKICILLGKSSSAKKFLFGNFISLFTPIIFQKHSVCNRFSKNEMVHHGNT